ncbi:MAG: hypothetical protein JNL10_07665 [Verrucomicrobiales bacterium]|nr:hypothetical protein [Verrucomicrobiales bacterium]
MKIRFSLLVAAVASVSTAPGVMACAACFGRTDSPLAYGMNAGIYSLLAVIGTMLGLIASFFVFVSRRASRVREVGEDSSAQ